MRASVIPESYIDGGFASGRFNHVEMVLKIDARQNPAAGPPG